jgi:hypothetical protein
LELNSTISGIPEFGILLSLGQLQTAFVPHLHPKVIRQAGKLRCRWRIFRFVLCIKSFYLVELLFHVLPSLTWQKKKWAALCQKTQTNLLAMNRRSKQLPPL